MAHCGSQGGTHGHSTEGSEGSDAAVSATTAAGICHHTSATHIDYAVPRGNPNINCGRSRHATESAGTGIPTTP